MAESQAVQWGRQGGLKANARKTPEQRREHARRMHLAGAVKAVVARAPELTDEQVAKLRGIFTSARGAAAA